MTQHPPKQERFCQPDPVPMLADPIGAARPALGHISPDSLWSDSVRTDRFRTDDQRTEDLRSDRLRSTPAQRALPKSYLIRPAQPGDARHVGRILSDWIDSTEWMKRIHTREEDRQHAGVLIASMEVSLVCRRRRLLPPMPVGFLARRAHFVHALYLAAPARGLGLGSALLAEAKAASPHLELWCFQANHPARAFYRAHGFTEAEFGDGSGNDEGLPDLRLIWRAE